MKPRSIVRLLLCLFADLVLLIGVAVLPMEDQLEPSDVTWFSHVCTGLVVVGAMSFWLFCQVYLFWLLPS